MSAEALPRTGELERWVGAVMGGRVISCHRVAGGRSRLICALDVECGSAIVPVLTRSETGHGPHSQTRFTLAREAALLRALQPTAALTPRVYGLSADGNVLLMERLPGGVTLPAAAAARQQVIAAYAKALADVHRLDAGLVLPQAGTTPDSRACALLDLADYEDSYRRLCLPHEIFERSLQWLQRHAPPPLARAVVLQGDAGPGNFLQHEGRITGLIDWEMAHGGDPHDDLAWIWFRVNVLRQDLEADSYFKAYAQVAGLDIEAQRVLYFIVQVIWRCAVSCGVRQWHDATRDDARPAYLRELLQAALEDASHGRLSKLPPLPAGLG